MKSYRVVFLGKVSVGKTSIVLRLIKNKFEEFISSTIGATFHTYQPQKYNGNVKLEIWDTAGQERYKSLAPIYYRNSSIVLIVYDTTDRDSFNIAKGWVNEIFINTTNDPVIAFIGNKIDLMEQRVVSVEEASSYAKLYNLNYYEISALSGFGIQSMFNNVTDKAVKRPQLVQKQSASVVMLNKYDSSICCY
jgi:Ras-related protein Rab-5C